MAYTSKGTQKKIDTVTELTEKVARAKSIVLTDYRGLKHKQLEELRRTVKKLDAQFVVTKNTLLSRAGLSKNEGATAALFAFSDEVAPLKELMKFFKAAGAGITKGGLLGDTVLSETDVTRLAGLPTRPQLLGQLAGQLTAPFQGLHYALNWNIHKLVWALDAVKGKKPTN
jgi:large subunit ribosomal protein L10